MLEFLCETGADVRMLNISLPDDYVEHGNVELLKAEAGIDAETVVKRIVTEYIGLKDM